MIHDVAIIGGGPAGSAAALILVQAGFRVAVIGPDAIPGDATRGETLGPMASPILARLGLSHLLDAPDFPVVRGFASNWGEEHVRYRPGFLVPDARTHRVDRPVFDRALRRSVERAGAFSIAVRARWTRWDGQTWRIGLETGDEAAAWFLIDASGRGGAFARRAGAKLMAVDRMIAATVVMPWREPAGQATVRIAPAHDGWMFAMTGAVDHGVFSFFTDSDLHRREQGGLQEVLRRRLLDQIRTVFPETIAAAVSEARFWSAATLILEHAGVPRLLAVGDAAQTRDPLSAQGIAAAMLDSEKAAHALIAASRGDHAALEHHERDRRLDVIASLRRRQQHYRAEQRWFDQPFWSRRTDASYLKPFAARLCRETTPKNHRIV